MQLLPHKDYATMFDLIQQGFRNSPFYGNSGKDIFIRYSKASEIVDLDGLTPTSCITDSNITGFIYEHCKRVGNTLLPKMLKVRLPLGYYPIPRTNASVRLVGSPSTCVCSVPMAKGLT